MSANRSDSFAAWRLLLSGNTSVTLRRVFVVILTAVSLTVWTVTVIGMGVLRSPSDAGVPVDLAGVSVAQPPREITVTRVVEPSRMPTLPVPDVAVTPSVKWLSRDPFVPDDRYFPQPKVPASVDGPGSLTARGQDPSGKGEGTTKQLRLVPLRLEATLLVGSDNVAIVVGNAITVGDQTWLLQTTKPSGQYRVGDKEIRVEEVRTHFRTGSAVDCRPVVKTSSGYAVAEKAEGAKLEIRKITDKSVVLNLRGKEYVLEMQK